jgi:hypothetical protein
MCEQQKFRRIQNDIYIYIYIYIYVLYDFSLETSTCSSGFNSQKNEQEDRINGTVAEE